MADAKYPWKLVWITGASGAICGEIARRLAAAGVTVAATARPSDRLDTLAAASENIKAFPADVLDADALKACAAKVEAELGPIDMVLLGAGMYVPFDIRNIDVDGFHKTMALNVDGVINGVAAVLPSMLARRQGHVAIMGSLFGYAGWPGNGSYGASKAAVINLAESLKLELERHRRRRDHHQSGLRRYAAQRRLRSEEEAVRHEDGALRAEDPREAAEPPLRDRLPAAGRGLPEDGAQHAAQPVLPAGALVHQVHGCLGQIVPIRLKPPSSC